MTQVQNPKAQVQNSNPCVSMEFPFVQSRIVFLSHLCQGSLVLLITSLVSLPITVSAEPITSDSASEPATRFTETPDPSPVSATPPNRNSATFHSENVGMENAIAAITDTEAAVGGDIDLLQTVPDAPELSGVSTSASDLLNTPEPVEYIIQEINLPQTLISSDIASDEPVNESEAIAQTDDEGSEEASGEGGLAAASQNPVGNLISVPLQNNVNFGVGEFDRTSYTLNIEPVIPTPLSDSLSLVNRAIIPVSYQPELARIPLPNGDVASIGDEFGLGDIAYQAYFVPKPSGNLTIGAGPFFLFPSATDDVLGTGKWGIGPTFAAVYSEGPVVAAILIDNLWSYAGDDDRSDISLMTIEPGINYNLDDGWSLYFGTGNGITANWLAEEGEKWTIPIGAGFGRVFPIGNQPVSMNLRGFWNAEKPEGAADWTLQLTVSLLFPE